MSSHYEKMLATGEVRCIDDEIPFDIPEGWEWERWGNIAYSIQYGYNASAQDYGNIRMVRISDIQRGCVLWDSVPYCCIDEKDIATYQLVKNDILFARTGGTVGKSFLVKHTPYSAIYAGYLIRTRYSELLCPYYLISFMDSKLYWDQLKKGTTATAQPNCNGQNLAKMLIPIPPKNEQKRIAERIEELTPKVDEYSFAQDKLNKLNGNINELLRKSILQEAIQGRLVPQRAEEDTAEGLLTQIADEKKRLVIEGKLKKSALTTSRIYREDNKYYEMIKGKKEEIDVPYAFPKSWQVLRLSDIGLLTDAEKQEGNQVLLDAKYLRGKSTPTIMGKGKFVEQGDFIILVDGENSGEVFTVPQAGYMGSTFKQLWISRVMHAPYVLAFIRFYKEMLRNSKRGAAIPHLNKELFYNLIIGIPPLAEQKRIAQRIEELTQLLK